ncbi:MAG TPA: RidA family protein [Gammaproteobacteria bacterium]|nr:RidA family protein [Gammaproteobacteria bacterium]
MVIRNNYSQLQAPVGPYIHAALHNRVLYTSGMTAYGTAADGASTGEQTKEIFRQLRVMLEEENSGLDKLIKVTIFVRDLSILDSLRIILFEIYGEHIPASSVVEVKSLFAPSVEIEIEAIAAVG